MSEHDGILQGHYNGALEQISNLTRERDDARQQLAEALARESVLRDAIRPFTEHAEGGYPGPIGHDNWVRLAYAIGGGDSAALLLALGKAAVGWKHNGDKSLHALTIQLGEAVDAALADPTLAQALRDS